MFDLAKKARPEGKNDLWPYWLFGTEGGTEGQVR